MSNEAALEMLINGVEYVRKDSIPQPTAAVIGSRIVLVGDRGWIFAGDASATANNEVQLDRAVGVRRWEGVGFNGMIADPTKKVVLEKMTSPVIFPQGSVIFKVPVPSTWGL